jgi:hypothetical protein
LHRTRGLGSCLDQEIVEGGQVKLNRLSLLLISAVAVLPGCGKSSSLTNVPEDAAPTIDTSAPAAPAGLAANGHYALVWDASSAADVEKYEVFRFSPDPSRLDAYVMIDVTGASTRRSAIINDASAPTHYYRVRAVDEAGNTSAMSEALAVEMSSVPPAGDGRPDLPDPPRKDEY